MKNFLQNLLELFGLGKRARFRAELLSVARSQIGLGEEGKNNHGPVIQRYAATAGMNAPILWCAAFVSWVYRETCINLGLDHDRHARVNAKRLADAVVAQGGAVVFYEHEGLLLTPKPGDLHVWHRGDRDISGHIGIITEYDPVTKDFKALDGNRGKFPSKVKYVEYNLNQKDLYMIVRLRELL